jgi:hypothetical protein
MTSVGADQVDLDPVKAFLSASLQQHCNGNSSQYHIIVQQFRLRDDPETLWKVILALNSFTSQITQGLVIFIVPTIHTVLLLTSCLLLQIRYLP